MASLTVRQLDDKVKKLLRLRAARHGRSMEDEIRTILRPGRAAARGATRSRRQPAGRRGIDRRGRPRAAGRARAARAATARPRAAHHRRRHRGLQIARPDPPAAGPRRDGALHPHRGGAGVRHAARRRRARGRPGVHRPVRSEIRIRRRPYPARARHRSRRGGARHRRPDGEDGGRPCRRSRDRGAARHRQADPDRAGDEPDDVGAQGDAAQSRATRSTTASRSSGPMPARWRSAARPAPAAWRSRWRSPPRR